MLNDSNLRSSDSDCVVPIASSVQREIGRVESRDVLARRIRYRCCGLKDPTEEISVNQTHKLDLDDVTNGVVAMVGAMNLYSGSSGSVELYRLNLAYLHDYNLPAEINALIEARWPDLPTFR